MPTRIAVPKFKSEREEAQWWEAHPAVVTTLFLKAKKEGRIERLPRVRGATKSVTIRLPIPALLRRRQFRECAHFCAHPGPLMPNMRLHSAELGAIIGGSQEDSRTMRFAFWCTSWVAMLSFGFAQEKPLMGRPVEITLATGKTLSSPRLWFDSAVFCDPETPRYIQQSLTVKMASGVEAGLPFSGVKKIEVTIPEKQADANDYSVAIHAPNKPVLSGKPWGFSSVCAALPPEEAARIRAEFPAGFQYPGGPVHLRSEVQCIRVTEEPLCSAKRELGLSGPLCDPDNQGRVYSLPGSHDRVQIVPAGQAGRLLVSQSRIFPC
jgi:hypothetical protein